MSLQAEPPVGRGEKAVGPGRLAAVTGADGLLGSHLVRRLLDSGMQVRVLVEPGSDSPTLEGLDVEKRACDLRADDSGLAEGLDGCDFVFHCAAVTDMWADPRAAWEVNLEGTRKVLDACLENGTGRLVHVGSASSFAFGPIDRPGDETGPFPEVYRGTAYMESKHEAMKLVFECVERRGMDAVVIAPTFMLGAYDRRPSGGELIRQFIKRGLSYVSPGGRNFANAADVADAAVLALGKGRAGEAYIAGGWNMRYLDFFEAVARTAGVDPPRRILPGPVVMAAGAAGSVFAGITRKRAVIDWKMARFSCCDTYYSSDRAQQELGMTLTPIERAIEDSVESLREYGYID
ncbi:MAG: NAD-dependent epimerase/dehydratase family protein [Actinobacteria bacterium]|nr:NAD-dependent epimerase/dehydratase family protein [Actinomycetota bacterium]MBU1945099.1 NAD-dependent epimerase/dehydratase family protein [Actinomycetota bacterium]MBU2687879.1 NAD-dependent epimerase/dehydratase family protein [Actinomycetota bacterium]